MIDYSLLKSIYNNAIDGLLSADGLTVPCSIIYEDPNGDDCPNCILNPITGRSSFAHINSPTVETVYVSGQSVLPDIYIFYIDENSATYSGVDYGHERFRYFYPDVLVFIMHVTPHVPGDTIQYPSSASSDDYFFSSFLDAGTYIVRDNGVDSIATDSYQLILDMINGAGVPSGVVQMFDNASSAIVALDSSGSTTPSHISVTSRNLINDLKNNGFNIVQQVDSPREELFCPYLLNSCLQPDNPLISGFYTECVTQLSWPPDVAGINWLCSSDYGDIIEKTIEVVNTVPEVSGNYVWFPDGSVCPICNGKGVLSKTSTETQNLAVIFDSKKFITLGNVNIPVGDIQVICPISLYPKLASASYITVDTNVTPYAQHRYTRISDPQPVGLGDNRYIFSNWERSA